MKEQIRIAPTLVAVGLIGAAPVQIWAQEAPHSVQLTTVVVTAERENYLEKAASVGTKTSTPSLETPLTQEVVSQQLMKDRGMLAPNDLANVVAGVQPLVGYGSSASQWFLIRGFDNQSINFRDGFRVSEPFTSSPRDLTNVERIEFIKGPASVLYGASQPGGAVNTVTKSAVDANFADATIGAGSNQYLRETLDINRSFGDLAFRLNVGHDAGNSYIDLQSSKNYLIAPALKLKMTPSTEMEYKGELQKTTFNGFSNGLPNLPFVVNLPASYTYAEPWNTLTSTNQSHLINIKTELSDNWGFRQGFYYGRTLRNFNLINPNFSTDPVSPTNGYGAALNGSNVQRISYGQSRDNPTNASSQTEITGTLQQGALTHRILGGFEFTRTVFDYLAAGDVLDTVNSSTFVPGLVAPLPTFNQFNNPSGFFGSKSTSSSVAFYGQDQVSLGNWRFLGGLRHEHLQNSTDKYENISGVVENSTAQDSNATTARIGALYMLSSNASVYYNFGQSFVPNIGTNAAGALFAPERGTQNEAGVKFDVLPQLQATVSAFDIVKRNYLTTDPTNTKFEAAIGQVESKGLEASLVGQVNSHLRIVANAAQINAKVTQDSGNPSWVGSSLTGVPKFSANLWAVQDLRLDISGKLSAGAGVVHVGERAAAIPNLSYFALPSYNSVDLGLFYNLDNVDIALNIKNINNAVILNSQEGDNVMRQAGRNFLLTVGMHF